LYIPNSIIIIIWRKNVYRVLLQYKYHHIVLNCAHSVCNTGKAHSINVYKYLIL